MYYTYILYSLSLNKYYVGYSSNLNLRINRHNNIHRGYTNGAKDWCLVYFEEFETKSLAIKRERQIKGWKSRIKIEFFIF